MGKVKIGIYCYMYLIADILTKVFWKYLLSGPPPNVYVVSKPLKLISCHVSQKAKFLWWVGWGVGNNFSEAVWGIKLKLCRNVHSMSLFKIISTFVAVATFSWTYNWKNKNWL